MNKKLSIFIGILVVAILGVGWAILSKGGLFAIELPQPQKIQTANVSANSTSQTGSVLGENSDYANPLKDIYVNPFQK